MTNDERKQRVMAALTRFDQRVRAGKVAEPAVPRAKRQHNPSAPPTEYQEQGAVCDWLMLHKVDYFAVLNGAFLAGSSPQQRGIRWRMLARVGAKQGVPDLVITSPAPARPELRAVGLEMKRAKGGAVSPEQHAWHELLEKRCGWAVLVGRGAEDAIRQLELLGYGRAA